MKRFFSELKTLSKSTVVAVLIALVLCGAALAWYVGETRVDLEPIEGTILRQYFHCGTGTEEDPFVITRPIHYYHLVELYQRIPDFSTADYHFQIGYDLDGDGDGVLEEGEHWLVYDYDDNGIPIGNQTATVLNMKYYDGSAPERTLLPVGTSDVPFNGTYEGNNLTISNIHIVANETVTDAGVTKTFGTADVGIFGYLGPDAALSNAYYDNVTIDLSNLDVDRIESESHNAEAHSLAGNTVAYVGYIAGHITESSSVQDVYINNCTIVGGDAAKCGFGYFGCVENVDGTLAQTLGSRVATLRTKGNDAGFGGSINMRNILERLQDVWDDSTKPSTYDSVQTVVIDEVNGTRSVATSDPRSITYAYNNYQYQYYSTEYAGKYYFFERNDMNNYQFMLIYGEVSLNPKSVVTYNIKDQYLNATTIRSGDHYLTASGLNSVSASTGSGSAWVLDGSGHLWTYAYFDIGNGTMAAEPRYLNASGKSGVTLGAGASTVWTRTVLTPAGDDPENPTPAVEAFTTNIDGTTYYLVYDGAWVLTPTTSYYLLSDGDGHYLSESTTGPITLDGDAGSVQWQLSDPAGATTQIYALLGDNDPYYLVCDGSLTVSTTPMDWTQTIDGETGEATYTYTLQGILYSLVYDADAGLWTVLPASGYRIENAENEGHFLTADANGISDSAVGTVWQFSSESGDTTISSLVGGTLQYLCVSNSVLDLSGSAATWHRSGDALYTTVDGTDFYLCYDGGWFARPLSYALVTDGSGNYMTIGDDGSIGNTTDSGEASHFYFSVNGTDGVAYAVAGGSIYYLNGSDGLNVSTSAGDATSWVNDGTSLYFTEGNVTYALCCDNGTWDVRTVNKLVITDGNGNYLRVTGTGNTDFTNTTDIDAATQFTFTSTNGSSSSGKVSTSVNGTTVYLYAYSSGGWYATASLQLTTANNTATSWSNSGNGLYAAVSTGFMGGSTTYYVVNNNGTWTLSTDTTANIGTGTYHISYNNNYYLNIDANGNISRGTNANSATAWSCTNANGHGGIYSTTVDGTTYYLVRDGSTLMTSTEQPDWSWQYTSNRLYVRENGTQNNRYNFYHIRYNNNAWSIQVSTNQRNNQAGNLGTSLTFTEVTYTQDITGSPDEFAQPHPYAYVDGQSIEAPEVYDSAYAAAATPVTVEGPYATDLSAAFADAQLQVVDKSTQNGLIGGYETYFPLRIADSDEIGWYDANDPYRVSRKNTGYIIGGARIQETNTTNQQKGAGDIRISYFPIAQTNSSQGIGGSYNSSTNTFTNIYTVNDSGVHTLTNAEKTDAYNSAAEQLLATLRGQSSVYGLHFMDAKISKDYLVTAEKAVILGTEYTDFEMPMDSIDFYVVDKRGTINFFAGAYYTDNDTFFSLHRVFRDANDKITAILEIESVYTAADNAPVVFKFKAPSGGVATYTNADGSYSGATSAPDGYTEVFKTAWITNPSGVTESNRIYYFEIPCNEGEYCLGSVSGKTGAYLIYLDIATNGGDIIDDIISTTGNEDTDAFKVEFRSAPDRLADGCYTVLQFSIDAPADMTADTFSVSTSFDATAHGTNNEYPNGLYTIRIVNKSSSTVRLNVYLCDDDHDITTPFGYAYRVEYQNTTHSTYQTILTQYTSVDYFQSMSTFDIPSSGDAAEYNYQ